MIRKSLANLRNAIALSGHLLRYGIGLSVYNKESSSGVEESLILIAQKCEHALKPATQITDNSVTIVSLQAVNSR